MKVRFNETSCKKMVLLVILNWVNFLYPIQKLCLTLEIQIGDSLSPICVNHMQFNELSDYKERKVCHARKKFQGNYPTH